MKPGIIVLLAAGAIAAVAAEPQAPAPPADAPPPDLVQPEVLTEVLTDQLEALRQQERDQKAAPEPPQVVWSSVRVEGLRAGRPCYFIRTLVPVMPEADMQRKGFIPLQARVNAVQRGPDCSNAGELAPLVPAQKPDDGQPQAGPALTPVALAPAPAAASEPAVAEP